MVTKGPAKKITIYVDETDTFHGKPVYEVLLDILFKKRIAGASVFRGVAGYGSDGVFHTAKMLALSTGMPVKIEAIDSAAVIDNVLPDVYHVVDKGLVEVSDTNVVKCCRNAPAKKEQREEQMKLEGKAKMLRIIISEDDKWEGEPLYEAIVKRLIVSDIAGATVYKAIAGYGPHKRYHKKKTLASHGELPVLVTVMDTEENIDRVLPILDELVQEGIVVLSDVNVIKYTHRDAGIEGL
jgi:PII-like signaling protein